MIAVRSAQTISYDGCSTRLLLDSLEVRWKSQTKLIGKIFNMGGLAEGCARQGIAYLYPCWLLSMRQV